jgi:maltose O-acetyltransferase
MWDGAAMPPLRRLRRTVKALLELEPGAGVVSLGTRIFVPDNVHLGERVSIGPDCFFSADSPITVGSDTMIAARVVINTATHDADNHPMWHERISRPIEIGEHVWIGTAAIILPGVRIGSYAVVGAGSVVTGHVPERAVVAGNPARIIRYRNPHEELAVEPALPYPGVALYHDALSDDRVVRLLERAEAARSVPPPEIPSAT